MPGKRCPNGTRKNKQGDCVAKSTAATKKRCPNGTRKNKQGNCVDKNGQPYAPRERTTPPSKENLVIMTANNLKKYHNVRMQKGVANRAFQIINNKIDEDASRMRYIENAQTLFNKAIEIAKENKKKTVTVADIEKAENLVWVRTGPKK
jgi:histone H3/H4